MNSRSGTLLADLSESGAFTIDELARELTISRDEVESYMNGSVAMPLTRQQRLALFVIDRSPRFARRGHALRAQVAAAMAFKKRATAVHAEPPTTFTSNSRRHR